jgi:hypothetical protein
MASVALLAAGLVLIYSLVGILFVTGRDSMLWAIFAFLTLAFLSVFTLLFRPLAEIWRGFLAIGRLFEAFAKACFVVAVVGVLLSFAGCAHGTVPPYDDLPIFARRPHYLLMGGPAGYFDVSHIRYLMSGAGFAFGWHCGALGFVSLLLRRLCCGSSEKTTAKVEETRD